MELTKPFGRCVRSVAEGKLPDDTQMDMLKNILVRYPWFTTARLLYSASSETHDPALKLHTLTYPRPHFMLAQISSEELGIQPVEMPEEKPDCAEETTKEPDYAVAAADPIDKFLAWDGHRTLPDDKTADEDASIDSARFDLSDNIISEELAMIYLAQGLNREAKEIYQRLCLLNPEKSVYFASIIEKIKL